MAQLHDGRWVKMRELTSADMERAADAAQAVSGITSASQTMRLNREGIRMALVAVSDPTPVRKRAPDGTVIDAVEPAAAQWKPLAYTDTEGAKYDDLFGAKARRQLELLFNKIHAPVEYAEDFFESIRSVSSTT